MMHVWSGHTTLPWRLPITLNFVRTLFVNGCRTRLFKLSMFLAKINLADIFTKEMRNVVHFRRVLDSFMSRLSDYLSNSILAIHYTSQKAPTLVTPAAAQVRACGGSSGYFSALGTSSFSALWRISLTYAVLVGISFGELVALFQLTFSEIFLVVFHPNIFPRESTFSFFSFAGRKDGRCWSVLGPFSRASRSKPKAHFSHQ